MIVTVSTKEAIKVLAEKIKHANAQANMCLLRVPPDRADERLGFPALNEWYRKAMAWEKDAFDAMALMESIKTDQEPSLYLDFKVIRWLYKHKAPESVQSSIGSFPG